MENTISWDFYKLPTPYPTIATQRMRMKLLTTRIKMVMKRVVGDGGDGDEEWVLSAFPAESNGVMTLGTY